MTSRELNIEIFPVFAFALSFCITFLIESHDKKQEDHLILESHEEKT